MPLLLASAEVEGLLTMEMTIQACEEAFRGLARGEAVNRPRTHTFLPTAEGAYLFKSMEGGVPSLGVYAMRLSSDHLTVESAGEVVRRVKRPTLPGNRYLGLILLFAIGDGSLIAILPDSYIARMRTGAKNGVGAKFLARANSRVLGLIGAGWQAGAQILAHLAVRPIEEVRVYSPTQERREKFAQEMTEKTGVTVRAVESGAEAVSGADIVAVATNSQEPALRAEWLEPGMHVSHIQSREMDPAVFERADLVVRRARTTSSMDFFPPALPDSHKAFLIKRHFSADREGEHDLLDILRGDFPGRTTDRQITVFGGSDEDGSIQGVLLAATAEAVYRRAIEKKIGREIPLEWFLEETSP
ncbi:MAG: ornithine cyclodeaminase family protein [Deltaproteobacteria bacterium]|nr:ornithine cyclodeaminase family protein [Deltaproteobacteria bacterium]